MRFGLLALIVAGMLASGCYGTRHVVQHNQTVNQGLKRPQKIEKSWTVVSSNVPSTNKFTAVSFDSKPQGVAVFLDRASVGTTPVSIRFPNFVDVEQQFSITYLEEMRLKKHMKNATDLDVLFLGFTIVPELLGAAVLGKPGAISGKSSSPDYSMISGDGFTEYVFPKKVLTNSPTGQIREVAKLDEKEVIFRFEDFEGRRILRLPKDNRIEFDFGAVRKAKPVTVSFRLDADDAYLGMQSPTNASVVRTADSTMVSLAGLEQDGIGRWWLNGQELKNHLLPIQLIRTTGQWVPPDKPISIALPRKYAAGSVELNVDVPLKALPWFWTRHPDWPAVDGTGISEQQRESWKSKLNDSWSSRESAANIHSAAFSGLLLRALADSDEARVREELGSFLREVAERKIKVTTPDFRKVDPATDPALAFEIQEDTLRGLREVGDAHFLFADSSAMQTSDYVMLIDLVNIGTDTQERIARSAGKVQIGTRKHANPQYYDLLKARVASEQMLARISSGGIEADSQASKQEGDALTRLLVGGVLANKGVLSPADSGGILLGVLDSLWGSDADSQKAQAYKTQLGQAQSAVNELSRQLASMPEYNEEPIYQDFRTEDRFVVKKALATAYVKVIIPNAPAKELFSRKIMSDVTVSDTFEEANLALGKKGRALDLPSDQQMKRDVAAKLTQELSRQIKEGFLFRLGLEHYAHAKFAEKNGDAEKFAESAILFLLSPAAKAYPNQARDALVLLEGLLQRATRSATRPQLGKLFGIEPKQG